MRLKGQLKATTAATPGSRQIRRRLRAELIQRYGLPASSTALELHLTAASDALDAGDGARAARALDAAGRCCEQLVRAQAKRPAARPSPAPAARLAALKAGVKSPLESSADLTPEKPTQLERLRAGVQVAPPPKEIPPLDQWKAPQ